MTDPSPSVTWLKQENEEHADQEVGPEEMLEERKT